MNEKLKQVIDILELQSMLSSQPTTVVLFDADGTVVYAECVSGIGSRVAKGDGAGDDFENVRSILDGGSAIRENTEYSGTAIECNYVPVKDGFDVVGCIVTKLAKSGTNERAIEKAEIFMDCIDKISSAVDMMGIHFEDLSDELQGMQEKTGFIGQSVEDTSNVVAKIKANASKSKILALNASIEAARSGEAGRGFTVVAKEMGEMATASGTSATEINEALSDIFDNLKNITGAIEKANVFAEKQTGSVKEIEEYLGAALQAAQELGEALS